LCLWPFAFEHSQCGTICQDIMVNLHQLICSLEELWKAKLSTEHMYGVFQYMFTNQVSRWRVNI